MNKDFEYFMEKEFLKHDIAFLYKIIKFIEKHPIGNIHYLIYCLKNSLEDELKQNQKGK